MIESSEVLEGIAIVGMSGRFPGAPDVAALWQNLREGRESIRTFSDAELIENGTDPALLKDPCYVRSRAVLDDVDEFDSEFFGLTPRDADLTDPQHRLFLECSWEALEDAGYDPTTYPGSIGVFGGASLNTYVLHHVFKSRGAIETFTRGFQVDGYNTLIASDKDYLATRVAYKLNLRGPAMTIQTACSTSLVAICQAVAALNAYQCDMALAGGVSVSFPQTRGYLYQEGAIASPDGHCRSFDADGKGTVFGSGCGVVLLKRLADACAAGDAIYAVIKGAAVNNDGADRVSYMAPSVNGQAEVIALAHALAGVSAESISYVEAHGTATPLGDPIEVAALTQAFRATTSAKQFCALGTVKSNFGHLEAAAGVTGMIKTALALHHRAIPPSLHYTAPNPKIDFANSPFRVVTELTPWSACPMPRRAGVSSFGVGGTNAHVVLEEAPAIAQSNAAPSPELLVVSARTDAALEAAVANFGKALQTFGAAGTPSPSAIPPPSLADIAFTLQTGRKAFDRRMIVVSDDLADAAAALHERKPKRVFAGTRRTKPPEVVFMFPGQGAQYVNMGRELYDTEPGFRAEVDQCSELLRPHLGLDLRTLLFPTSASIDDTRNELTRTVYTQPALFVIEYALARLWMAWGVKPAALVGHSIGEYVAAVLADVMTLHDALRVIAARARLMESMPRGGMVAVRLPEAEVAALLTGSLAVAVVNSPALTVVAGTPEEIAALERRLTARGVACKELHTSHAFHSPMMEPMLAPFREIVATVPLQPAKLPIISTLTGTWIKPDDWTAPDYWTHQLRKPVRFSTAVATMSERPDLILLEVGPGQTLTALAASQTKCNPDQLVLASMPPVEKSGEPAAMLQTLGRLWITGVAPDWLEMRRSQARQRVHLPTYPFQRRRHWIDAPAPQVVGSPRDSAASQSGARSAQPQTVARGDPSEAISVLVQQQLQLMRHQLALLSGTAAETPNPPAPHDSHPA